MDSRPSFPALLAGIAGGSAATAAAHAVLFPELVGTAAWDQKFLALLPATWAVAGVFALAAWFVPRLQPPAAGGAFWAGCGLALAPLLAGWLFTIVEPPGGHDGSLLLLPLGVGLGLALAVALPRVVDLAVRPAWSAGIALLALAAFVTLYARVGVPAPVQTREPLPPPPAATGPAAADRAAPGERPVDVLLVSVDTLRADVLEDERFHLPALEKWGQEGVRSKYALAPASMTIPSHITMLSGRSPLQHGAWNNKASVPPDLPLAAEWFAENGWRTAAVVSNHMLRESNGFARGFQAYATVFARLDEGDDRLQHARRIIKLVCRWSSWQGWLAGGAAADPLTDHLTDRRRQRVESATNGNNVDETVAAANEYLDSLLEDEAPYFLFLHFMDPHAPYDPHRKVAGELADPSRLPERYARLARVGSGTDTRVVEDDLQAKVPGAELAARHMHDLYLEEVRYVDRRLDEVVERILASGRPTVMLFTSDHGEHFGDHRLMNHNNSVYEPLLKVPFLLAGKGVEKGRNFARPPRLEDVAPTLLALAGLPPLPGLDGVDLLDEGAEPESYYWSWMEERFALRDENGWKLIGSFRRGEDGYHDVEALELYHLPGDPAEERNLLTQEPERARRLLEQAQALLAVATVGKDDVISEERQAELEGLGYAVDE